jgi:hypothetical protein
MSEESKLDKEQQEAFDGGAEAWLECDLEDNPYEEDEEPDLWYAWDQGWKAQEKLGVQEAWRRG